VSADFSDFWEAYPHRNGKKKNRKGADAAFLRAIKAGAMVSDIAKGVEAMRRDPDVMRGYARDPTTWLNQQGWTDEIPQSPQFQAINGGDHDQRNYNTPPHGHTHRPDAALEQIARLAGI